MLRVILNSVVVALGVGLSHLHAVDANTVVSESFSVDIANSTAHLQEFLVLLNSKLVFTQVIVQHARRVVGAALIAGLASSLAGEGENFVILKSFLSGNSIVGVTVAHRKA